MQSSNVNVEINLLRIRENVLSISAKAGLDVIAVVKADGYGLGAREIAQTIGSLVAGFCVFSLQEAKSAGLWEIARKPILALGPSFDIDVNEYVSAHVRPAVWTVDEARRLRPARPILAVDTGMRRFACPPEHLDEVIAAGQIDEAFTHATQLKHAQLLASWLGNRGLRLHAAASGLLDEPAARFDAVRPGMAIYRGAARVATHLVETRDGDGPAGYSEFNAARFGVILCGYSNGLRRGPCLVNGQPRSVLEVGMQSAFVEIGPGDKAGDEVVLLGDSPSAADVARAWGASEQQALFYLVNVGRRTYRGG